MSLKFGIWFLTKSTIVLVAVLNILLLMEEDQLAWNLASLQFTFHPELLCSLSSSAEIRWRWSFHHGFDHSLLDFPNHQHSHHLPCPAILAASHLNFCCKLSHDLVGLEPQKRAFDRHCGLCPALFFHDRCSAGDHRGWRKPPRHSNVLPGANCGSRPPSKLHLLLSSSQLQRSPGPLTCYQSKWLCQSSYCPCLMKFNIWYSKILSFFYSLASLECEISNLW